MKPIIEALLEEQSLEFGILDIDRALKLILVAFKEGYDRMRSDFQKAKTPGAETEETNHITGGTECGPLQDPLFFDSVRNDTLAPLFRDFTDAEDLLSMPGPSNTS